MKMISAYLTATRVVHGTSGDPNDYTETSGWVDPTWSRVELFGSRNDVAPVICEAADSEDLRDQVMAALGQVGSPVADNGDGSFYGQGEYDSGVGVWTYAVHFKQKYFHPECGWTEVAWHPVTDGGLVLDAEEGK